MRFFHLQFRVFKIIGGRGFVKDIWEKTWRQSMNLLKMNLGWKWGIRHFVRGFLGRIEFHPKQSCCQAIKVSPESFNMGDAHYTVSKLKFQIWRICMDWSQWSWKGRDEFLVLANPWQHQSQTNSVVVIFTALLHPI